MDVQVIIASEWTHVHVYSARGVCADSRDVYAACALGSHLACVSVSDVSRFYVRHCVMQSGERLTGACKAFI